MNELEVFRTPTYKYFTFNNQTYLLNTYPYMDIVLGDACNCRCKFCIANLLHHKLKLDVEKAKSKIKYANEFLGVKEFLVLGGEPTIYDSMFDIVSYLKTLDVNKICMTTNGHRMVKDYSFAEMVFKSGITHLNISLMSVDCNKQKEISRSNVCITLDDLAYFRRLANRFGVHIRFNSNSFKGNNDTTDAIEQFYLSISNFANTVKISSLLQTDSFSTVDEVSKFTSENKLSNDAYDSLFRTTEAFFMEKYHCGLTRNNNTLGFVENSLLDLGVHLIFNYNHSGRLMKEFNENKKINGFKLLPNGEISISWNRERKDLYVRTDQV